jgi:4-alpha-glucanotransferase
MKGKTTGFYAAIFQKRRSVSCMMVLQYLPNNTWKGAGVAIPVFSLRSKNSFGTGEFADIKLLVDWAKATGIKLIQILPVNDTMANFNRMDSYPYSTISAFALHPLYINLEKVAGNEFADQLISLKTKQEALNELPVMDYEAVMKYKFSVLKALYEVMGDNCFESGDYKDFLYRISIVRVICCFLLFTG